MKKFFTLLTLLVGICTGAWGADATPTYTQPTAILDLKADGLTTTLSSYTWSSNKGNISQAYSLNDDYLIFPLHILGKTIANNASLTWAVQENSGGNADDGAWTASGIFPASTTFYSTAERQTAKLTTTRMVAIKVTCCSEAYLYAAANCVLNVYEVTASNVAYNTLTIAGTATTSSEGIVSVTGLDASKTYIVQATGSTSSNAKGYAIGLKRQDSGTPVITANNASITTTTSGVDATENIAITGANLTANGTLTATLNPAVTGLSVDLASNSIDANGAISTTATLTYNATANATGETTLVLSDGTTTKNVKITYLAQVTAWSLQTISTAKTWDFSTLSGGKQYSGDDLTVEHVYANINEIICPSSFDATALAFTGQYPLRSGNGIAQNGTLKFRTSVPGTIKVTFSDTGTSASSSAVKRYLVVNGVQTAFWTSRENNGSSPYAAQLNVTADAIAVPAGNVTISGSSAIAVKYLSFIPGPADPTDNGSTITIETTANMDGYRAFYDASQGYTLDNDTKAYVATAQSGSNITMTPISNVPAGTPVILKTTAASHTMTLTKATPAAYEGTNLLAVTVANADVDGYRLGYNSTDGVAFYPYQTSSASAGIIYLNVAVSARALNFSFEDEDVTGISEAKSQQPTANSQFFDLSGRRVAQPTKGLYIVNGKKVVIK